MHRWRRIGWAGDERVCWVDRNEPDELDAEQRGRRASGRWDHGRPWAALSASLSASESWRKTKQASPGAQLPVHRGDWRVSTWFASHLHFYDYSDQPVINNGGTGHTSMYDYKNVPSFISFSNRLCASNEFLRMDFFFSALFLWFKTSIHDYSQFLELNSNQAVNSIDYWLDDEKKKLFSWVDILVYLCSWRLQDSKNAGHEPSPSTCSSVNSKKLSCMDCQSPTPTSQNSPSLVNRSAD